MPEIVKELPPEVTGLPAGKTIVGLDRVTIGGKTVGAFCAKVPVFCSVDSGVVEEDRVGTGAGVVDPIFCRISTVPADEFGVETIDIGPLES